MNEAKVRQQGSEDWKRKIHFQIEKDGDIFYLCNQACSTFPEKRTTNKDKVTCMNCLRNLKKQQELVK